jgi:hypothetical protein
MTAIEHDDQARLRAAIAAGAARMIVEDGAEYGAAKRKAARQALGEAAPPPNALPDNAEVEAAVRSYQALFRAATQPARLRLLRATALQVMAALAEFRPYLSGAVLSGSAGAHDGIDLQLFTDSAKDVEIFLLNRDVQFEVAMAPHFKGARHEPVETLIFAWNDETVRLTLYDTNDLRGALKLRADGSAVRADAATVQALIDLPELKENA